MASKSKTPKNWPSNIQYLTAQRWHPSVSAEALTFLRCGLPAPGSASSNSAPSYVFIRRITESSHPACGQCGLFASKRIPTKTCIIDYIGEVHCDDRPGSDYDLSLHRFQDGTSVGVDADKMGNESRFINDYRGVSSKPNAEFKDRRVAQGELRMSVWSLVEIKKGEEITVSYGKAWWKARTEEAQASWISYICREYFYYSAIVRSNTRLLQATEARDCR